MQNHLFFLTSFLMVSSSLISTSPLSARLIANDSDIIDLRTVGHSKFLDHRAKKVVAHLRLSDKGDLTTNTDETKRRQFYMTGDGDCFFHAIPQLVDGKEGEPQHHITRADAVSLWLQHATDRNVRDICAPEIFEMFMASLTHQSDHQTGLPSVMTNKPLYREFKESLSDIRRRMNPMGPYDWERFLLLSEETELKRRILTEYCAAEETFRSYVTHVLSSASKFMMFSQDVLDQQQVTFFIDGLAYILRKNLVIWNSHIDNPQLIQVHSYSPPNAAGTWEVFQTKDHFNRLVPVTDAEGLRLAKADEDRVLQPLMGDQRKADSSLVTTSYELLRQAECESLSHSNLVSGLQQQEYTAEARRLKARLPKKGLKKPSKPALAAYYKALIHTFKTRIEALNAELNKQLHRPVPIAALMGNQNYRRRHEEDVRKFDKAEKKHQEKLPALRMELEKIEKKLPIWQSLFQALRFEPDELDFADALLLLTLHQQQLESRTEQGLDPSFGLPFKHLKVLFGEAFSKLQDTVFQSIAYQLKSKKKAAKQRLDALRSNNLKVDDCWSYKSDFDEAQAEVHRHYQTLQGRPGLCFNPEYLSGDPFLSSAIPDIIKDYPTDITDAQWKAKLKNIIIDMLHFLIIDDQHDEIAAALPPTDLFQIGTLRESVDGDCRDLLIIEGTTFILKTENEVLEVLDHEVPRQALVDCLYGLSHVFSLLMPAGYSSRLENAIKLGRKKVYRVIDTMVKRASSEEEGKAEETLAGKKAKVKAALTLAQNSVRCIDGLFSGLELIEADLFQDSTFTENEIGKIFSHNAHMYCAAYAGSSKDSEWRTNAPQFVKQRTFYALPHKGEPHADYLVLGDRVRAESSSNLRPDALMRTFLEGGTVTFSDGVYYDENRNEQIEKKLTVVFKPFNAARAVTLLVEAYQRGLKNDRSGPSLTDENIIDFIKRDDALQRKFTEFSDALAEGNVLESDFFTIEECQSEVKSLSVQVIRYKPKLFETILVKLGYLIPTNELFTSSKDGKKSEEKKNTKAEKEKTSTKASKEKKASSKSHKDQKQLKKQKEKELKKEQVRQKKLEKRREKEQKKEKELKKEQARQKKLEKRREKEQKREKARQKKLEKQVEKRRKKEEAQQLKLLRKHEKQKKGKKLSK